MSINDVVTGLETRANELKKNALAELQEAQDYQRELDALDAQAAQVESAIEDLDFADEQVAQDAQVAQVAQEQVVAEPSVDDLVNGIDLDALDSKAGIQL